MSAQTNDSNKFKGRYNEPVLYEQQYNSVISCSLFLFNNVMFEWSLGADLQPRE